jgi:hypothetical protein
MTNARIFAAIALAAVISSGCSAGDANVSADKSGVSPEPSQSGEPAPEARGITFLSDYLPEGGPDFALYAPEPKPVKSIYISQSHMADPNLREKRLELCDATEVNSVVIDIKETDGAVTFTGIEYADSLGVSADYISDIWQTIRSMKERGVYVIGRVVVMKDDRITDIFPDFALRLADGEIFREAPVKLYDGRVVPSPPWLNPYNRDVWNYVASIAEGAAQMGFDEIQFDYIRFPSSSKIDTARFGDTGGLSRTEIIAEMTKYLAARLKPYGVKVAADVYGAIVLSETDANLVGQDFILMAKELDYICPMPYPSHFDEGSMGIDYPDLRPYDTIYAFLRACDRRISEAGGVRAKVRPWLQDFTARWIDHWQEYGGEQIRQQINACYDAGFYEWMLWGSGGVNSADGLLAE